ncbi:MAG: FHA domain-containing protein [Planctomycetes bacterium]|nr:FHA domain-containing protein [Planctomycetota bacterium]
MKTVLVMFKDGERRDFPLADGKTVIGRREDCGLRIPIGDVSRQHCEVEQAGNQLVVRDLGSSNGTYINGKRIAEAKLMAGDKLAVGPVMFIVQINGLPGKLTPFDAKVEPVKAPETAARKPEPAKAAAPQPTKPAEKKKRIVDADAETEEILNLSDVDLNDMFGDDDDDDDDNDELPPKGKK